MSAPLAPLVALPPDAWIRAVRDDVEDLYAAAEDATRPPGERDLGRRTAREFIQESHRALAGLLASPPPPFTATEPSAHLRTRSRRGRHG